MGLFVGRGRKARRCYGFDEIALVPGEVTINPNEVDTTWELKEKKYEIRSWKDLLVKLCDILITMHGTEFEKVLSLVGRKRPYFTRNANELRSPGEIAKTDIFVELNVGANLIVKICLDMIALFGYSSDDLRIEAH